MTNADAALQSVLPRLVESLAAQPDVERAYLFGSRARGQAEARSDIDLAIAAPSATAQRWHAILDQIDALPTLLPIDVTRLEDASPAFKAEILATAQVIFAR